MTRNILSAALLLCFLAAATIYITSVSPDQGARPEVSLITFASQVVTPPSVMFRTLAPKQLHGRVAMVPTAAPGRARHVAPLSCARVHFSGGAGLCLTEEMAGATVAHAAYIFDRTFTRTTRIDLTGIPTRARVSRDGRMAAVTVYAEEHAPNGGERVATNSMVIDIASGRVIANLREMALDNPVDGPLDFASISFERDADRFFATMSHGGEDYLIAGSMAARRLTIVAPGMASEALSPDGRYLIVKKRVGDRGRWQLAVFDLVTKAERSLNQGPRSVDDQVEWLDGHHVMYHDTTDEGTGVWVLPTDGIAGPRLLIADAYSPSVQQ